MHAARKPVLVAILLAGLAGACRMPGPPLPPPGQEPAPGTPADLRTDAEILWDTWGVPHIYARDTESAFRAFGWAQMHSHGNLLLKLYALARGQGARYFGPQYVPSDQAVRTFGLNERGQEWYRRQSPGFRRNLDAFAEGVNEYARQNADRLDPAALAVLPIRGTDLLAHAARGFFAFILSTSECQGFVSLAPKAGSNGWTIAPSRSTTGHGMLLVNPHLNWSEEELMFEAQLVAPGYAAYGAALVGMPVLTIAFNDHLGWTHTVDTLDACDVYELTPAGDGYLFDGQARPFEVRDEVLEIKQPDGSLSRQPLRIRRAVQGPVVERSGKTYALRTAGVDVTQTPGSLEEWWDMGRARDLAEFRAAIERLELPFFNILYADVEGHNLLVFNGHLPERPGGDALHWLQPVPGNTSANLWHRRLPFSRLPQVLDPPIGWAQNSNSAPWFMTLPLLEPRDFPPYLALTWRDDPSGTVAFNAREHQGLRMLQARPGLSYEQLIADKFDTHAELTDRVLADLIAHARGSSDALARQAADVLERWDRRAEPDSRGAALFYAWYSALTSNQPFTYQPFAAPLDPGRLLETPRGLKDPEASVQALVAAAGQVQSLAGRLDVPYGELFRMQRGKVDLPARGGPDGLGIFRVLDFAPAPDGKRFVTTYGDTYVAAIELSRPIRAKVLLTYGNTSDPASPHYGDQLPLYLRNELRNAWRTREEALAHLEARTVFPHAGAPRHTAAP